MHDNMRKAIGVILLVSLLSVGFFKPFKEYLLIPSEMNVFENQTQAVPVNASISAEKGELSEAFTLKEEHGHANITGQTKGRSEVVYDLAGFPIKKTKVRVLPELKVIPGGQSIGVKLHSVGVLVVGFHQVMTKDGKKSPGEQAGIESGDIIIKMNGHKIDKMSDIAPFIQKAGKTGESLDLLVKRDKQKIKTKLIPTKDEAEGKYRIGLYIRDSAAGIGTMTFFGTENKKITAHWATSSLIWIQKNPIVVEDGEIVRSTVTSIEKGKGGNPGEKLARFSSERKTIGDINRNSPFGIFGTLHQPIKNNISDKALPIALSNEVKKDLRKC